MELLSSGRKTELENQLFFATSWHLRGPFGIHEHFCLYQFIILKRKSLKSMLSGGCCSTRIFSDLINEANCQLPFFRKKKICSEGLNSYGFPFDNNIFKTIFSIFLDRIILDCNPKTTWVISRIKNTQHFQKANIQIF